LKRRTRGQQGQRVFSYPQKTTRQGPRINKKKDLQNEVCRNTQGSFLRPAACSVLAPLMFLSASHLHDKQHDEKGNPK